MSADVLREVARRRTATLDELEDALGPVFDAGTGWLAELDACVDSGLLRVVSATPTKAGYVLTGRGRRVLRMTATGVAAA